MWMKIIMCKLHLQVSGQYLIITIHFVKHNVSHGFRRSFQLISASAWTNGRHAQSLQRTTHHLDAPADAALT